MTDNTVSNADRAIIDSVVRTCREYRDLFGSPVSREFAIGQLAACADGGVPAGLAELEKLDLVKPPRPTIAS